MGGAIENIVVPRPGVLAPTWPGSSGHRMRCAALFIFAVAMACEADTTIVYIAPDAYAPMCNDGQLTPDEACEGANVRGLTCAARGLSTGQVTCTATCGLSFAGCSGRCGDAIVQGPEEACDDGVNDGAYGGCLPGCRALAPHCGDGRLDPPEACDGAPPLDASCTPGVGRVSCAASCAADRSACRAARPLSEAGIVITSDGVDDYGTNFAAAGDVDGDGYADLLIGAPRAGANFGRVYVVFGGPSLVGRISLSDVGARVRGARIDGSQPYASAGASVSAGDLDGDRSPDIVIGAPGYNAGAQFASEGGVFVFRGPDIHDAILDQATFSIIGAVSEGQSPLFGEAVLAADLSLDQHAELWVGAGCARFEPVFDECGGGVYAFADVGTWSGRHSTGEARTIHWGRAFETYGAPLRTIGDTDGDGALEMVIGSRDTRLGRLLYGPAPTSVDLDRDPIALEPVYADDPRFAAPVGDVDGDGRGEWFLNSELDDRFHARLMWGSSARHRGQVIPTDARAVFVSTPGSITVGSGAGDLNADATPDWAIVTLGDMLPPFSGAIYLFAGAPTVSGVIDVRDADAKWVGTSTGAEAGSQVVPVGDINGDGFGDLLIANKMRLLTDPGHEIAYVVFGGRDAL